MQSATNVLTAWGLFLLLFNYLHPGGSPVLSGRFPFTCMKHSEWVREDVHTCAERHFVRLQAFKSFFERLEVAITVNWNRGEMKQRGTLSSTGRQAGRQEDRQEDRQTGRQTYRQAGGRAAMTAMSHCTQT